MDVQAFVDARSELIRRPGPYGPGRRSALSALTDDWVAQLFAQADATRGADICLVAVGGYGRGELSPGSDLDLLLLHRVDIKRAAAVADAIWYPIWDSGLSLDHSVRTVADARRLAADDLKVVLGLLDARVIAGSPDLAEQLRGAVLADWRSMAGRRLPELRALVESRRERYGELSQLLEPDLKESYGGIREATILRAIAASWLTDIPHAGWPEAHARLLDMRDALHAVSGRSSDALLLQEQAHVAQLLGMETDDDLLRSAYLAGRTLAYASDTAWHRVSRLTRRAPRIGLRSVRRAGPERTPLADGVVVQDGEVVLAADARPDRDPVLVLRAAAAAAQAGLPLAPHTAERLAKESAPLPVPWPRSARESFVSLLGAGAPLVGVWEAFDQLGVIESLLPGWDVIRSAPQRNAIHRFTVDRHLVETAVQAGALTRRVTRPDLLLIAALLHDFGKSRPGDHSIIGAELAQELARRMGFDDADARRVAALVRYHLVLPDTATRRDLTDPATTAAVLAVLPDHELLDLMNALVEADSMATGPAAWSEWRRRLIDDLTRRCHEALAGDAPATVPALETSMGDLLEGTDVRVRMIEREEDCELAIAAPDRLGLLATVAGILALHRLEVRAARVQTVESRALQSWIVRPLYGEPPGVELIAEDIRRALDGSLDVAARLARKEEAYADRRRVDYAPARVDVIDDASATTTVLEVRSHDAPGLLYRIAQAVAAADACIEGAKVATLGSEVVDVFFLTGPDGGPLAPARADAVRVTVEATLRAASA